MKQVFTRLVPSPSMAVAMLALCVALSGSAYAAAKINGKNIKNRSIAGAKLKKNTLGANEIKESSIAPKLPTVPSAVTAANAAHADAAAALDSLKKFGARQPVSTAETEVLNTGKLRVTQECGPAGELTLRAYTLVDDASIIAYGTSSDTNDDDFDTGEGAKTISASDEERDLVYSEPGGQTVALQYIAAEQPDLASGGCLVSGFAIAQ